MSGHALKTFSEKPSSMPNQDSELMLPWASYATVARHRSVCVSEMTTAVLKRMGIVADIDHLCETDWRHLCQRAAPCPACQFVATRQAMVTVVRLVLRGDDEVCTGQGDVSTKTGGSTLVYTTSTSCPGQCCHPSPAGRTADPHHRTSPKPPREVEGNPKNAHDPSQGAPRELLQDIPPLRHLQQQQMSGSQCQRSLRMRTVPGTSS